MSSAPYLFLSRHGIFYFRIVVPKCLRGQFGVRHREFKVSLRTREKSVALMQSRAIHAKIDTLFSQIGKSMAVKRPPIPMGFDAEYDPQTGKIRLSDIKPDEVEAARRFLSVANAQPASPEISKHRLANAKLSDVVDEYLVFYKPSVILSTFERRRGHLRLFVEYFANCKISEIGRAKMSSFWDDLKFLPPQKDVRPEYRDQKIEKVLEKQKIHDATGRLPKGISPQTQAHYREAVSGLYGWCVDREVVDVNIAAQKSARTKRYADEMDNAPREPYSADELKRIFEHDFYRQAEYRHAYQYWIPHIALYTGARINEIAQLYLEDIEIDTEYSAFYFCALSDAPDGIVKAVPRPDISRKNKPSTRITPIHPKLIELGLITYRDQMLAAGHVRMFPELPHSKKGGYGTRASRWFMEEFLRPKVGITKPTKVFHSFRHTVLDELGDVILKIPLEVSDIHKDKIVKAIVGHKMEDITIGHYKKQFHPRFTGPIVEQLSWNLELTPYSPLRAQASALNKLGGRTRASTAKSTGHTTGKSLSPETFTDNTNLTSVLGTIVIPDNLI